MKLKTWNCSEIFLEVLFLGLKFLSFFYSIWLNFQSKSSKNDLNVMVKVCMWIILQYYNTTLLHWLQGWTIHILSATLLLVDFCSHKFVFLVQNGSIIGFLIDPAKFDQLRFEWWLKCTRNYKWSTNKSKTGTKDMFCYLYYSGVPNIKYLPGSPIVFV